MRLAMVLYAAAVVLAAPASGSELIQDTNAQLVSLQVNGKGEALVTYRRADGSVRHGSRGAAINARAPSQEIPQVRFRWDYAGGWGKYRNGRYWQTFRNTCFPYDVQRCRWWSPRARPRTAATGRCRAGSGVCRSSGSTHGCRRSRAGSSTSRTTPASCGRHAGHAG